MHSFLVNVFSDAEIVLVESLAICSQLADLPVLSVFMLQR